MNNDYNHVLDSVRRIIGSIKDAHYAAVSSQCAFPEWNDRVHSALFGESRIVDGKTEAIPQTMWEQGSLIASRVMRSSPGSNAWTFYEARWSDPQHQRLVYIECTVGVSVFIEVFASDGVHLCAEAMDNILARLSRLASQPQDPSE